MASSSSSKAKRSLSTQMSETSMYIQSKASSRVSNFGMVCVSMFKTIREYLYHVKLDFNKNYLYTLIYQLTGANKWLAKSLF